MRCCGSRCQEKEARLRPVKNDGYKGEELTWEDFEQYHGVECGSGLYIVRYEIDGDYELMIGGTSATGSPMYIHLVRKDSEDESGFIDIRTEDVQAFIDETR